MKFYWKIRFNGRLNRKRTFCDLIAIEFDTDSSRQIPYLFNCDLSTYLYRKRGKTKELGKKNGPGTSGWLEVKDLFSPSLTPDLKIVKIDSLDISGVYKQIKGELKKAIDEKIKIKERKKVKKCLDLESHI